MKQRNRQNHEKNGGCSGNNVGQRSMNHEKKICYVIGKEPGYYGHYIIYIH